MDFRYTSMKESALVKLPPNQSLRRSVIHRVLGRGRPCLVPSSAPPAHVLTSQLAATEL